MVTRAAGCPGRKKPVSRSPLRVEGLDPLLGPRNIGDDDVAVTRDVEAGGLDDAPLLAPDLDDLAAHAVRAASTA